jgi:hypothetical protein
VATEKPKDKRRAYLGYAFNNVYNYALLGGVAATAALTQNWWLALAGAALEGLWLMFAPDARLLGRLAWDQRWAAEEQVRRAARRKQEMQILSPGDWRRCHALEAKRGEIERLAAGNQTFAQELLKDELGKLERLVDAYTDMHVTVARFEQHLASADFDELERSQRRFESQVSQAQTREDRQLAQKNLDVVLRRKERLAEIQSYVRKAHGQLDLIENTFKLLADQIVTMRSPAEMGGQLDDLMDGVEAVRTTARETEGLMQSAER